MDQDEDHQGQVAQLQGQINENMENAEKLQMELQHKTDEVYIHIQYTPFNY